MDEEKVKTRAYWMNFKLDAIELLAQIIKRKMAFSGHACRNNKCNLEEEMPGKGKRGRPRMQYIDNIKKWTRASLEEDRTAWRERSCAAGAADVRTDDADWSKVSETGQRLPIYNQNK